MPQYDFLPLSRHSDYGFGATADAFKESADELYESDAARHRLNGHLVIAYLYRHAAELYFKSMIVVLHRRLRIPFGADSPDGEPCIVVGTSTKPIHKVHSVKQLFEYFERLVNRHASDLATFCKTDWTTYPRETRAWIEAIENSDPKSTFFRYPNPQARSDDHDKSSFQTSTPDEILASAGASQASGQGTVCVLTYDNNDNIVDTFLLKRDVFPELQAALRQLCDLLEAAHFGMRIELADGT